MAQTTPYVLPSNEEIFETLKMAKRETIRFAAEFGIKISQRDTLPCQLVPSVPKAVNPKTNISAKLTHNEELCDDVDRLQIRDSSESTVHTQTAPFSDWNLRDYTDSNIVLNELSPFTQVKDKNGNSKVVRKSSIVWLLTTSKNKLSSDRLRRVQSKCIENANRSLASAFPTYGASMNHSYIWIATELNVGDWCYFHQFQNRSTNSKAKVFENLRVGLVVAFKYITGRTLREKQYPWDNASVRTNLEPSERRGILVLATWYTYNENGSLDSINGEKKHLFLDMEDYVATTRAITRSPNGILKIDLDSVHLCQFNQELHSLIGTKICINIHTKIFELLTGQIRNISHTINFI